jgi:CRISPR-associated protein Cmr3
LGKPKSIGGFDLYKKSPKSISKYVPEGSVYYFEIINADNNNWKEILKNLNFKTIYEFYNKDNKDYILLENLKKEGFGQILIGGW